MIIFNRLTFAQVSLVFASVLCGCNSADEGAVSDDPWENLIRAESEEQAVAAWESLRPEYFGEDFRTKFSDQSYAGTEKDSVLFRKAMLSLMQVLDVPPNGNEFAEEYEWSMQSANLLDNIKVENNWLADTCFTIRTLRELYEINGNPGKELSDVRLYQLVALNSLDSLPKTSVFTDGIPVGKAWWKSYVDTQIIKDDALAGDIYSSELDGYSTGDRAIVWQVHQALIQVELRRSVDSLLNVDDEIDLDSSYTAGFIGIEHIQNNAEDASSNFSLHRFFQAKQLGIKMLNPRQALSEDERSEFYRKGLCAIACYSFASGQNNRKKLVDSGLYYAREYQVSVLAIAKVGDQLCAVLCMPTGSFIFI